jgi:PBP1b-binding outer membrane lipoprotein LpoB
MNTMKKVCIIAVMAILFAGCTKVDVPTPQPPVTNAELKIASAVGIKLQSAFVTNEVAMNVKSNVAQTATIRIFDISNRVVSKETINVNAGDNIVKVYTSALPSSAYRIGLFDANNNMLAITDFNKL